MPRKEDIGGPQSQIFAEYPDLKGHLAGIGRELDVFVPETGVIAKGIESDRKIHDDPLPYGTKTNAAVKVASVHMNGEVIAFYSGDKEHLNSLLPFQAMFQRILHDASPEDLRQLLEVFHKFHDANSLEYVDHPFEIRLLRVKPFRTIGPAKDGQVLHKIILPSSLATTKLSDVTHLITRYQEAMQRDWNRLFPPPQPQETSMPASTRRSDRPGFLETLFGLSPRDNQDEAGSGRRGQPENEGPESARATIEEPQKSTRKLADQRGMPEEAIILAEDLVDQIRLSRDPHSIFSQKGGKIKGGFTLSGPTGTGKTTLVEAIAGEVNASILRIRSTDVMVMWENQSGRNFAQVRQAVKEFFKSHPKDTLILLLNEGDAMLSDRAGMGAGDDGKKQFVGASLDILDTLRAENEGHQLIEAITTNFALDPAVQGRIGPNIEVRRPDTNGKAEIFSKYLADWMKQGGVEVLAPDLRAAVVAYETAFAAGADRSVLQPLLMRLVQVLNPVLKEADWGDVRENVPGIAGREIEKIVKDAYSKFLSDASHRESGVGGGMTVEGYLLPELRRWKSTVRGSEDFKGFTN